jgi:hypothetical protein
MCNCSSNSCDCNDYRVSTGPQGNTGPSGPQGPAGPPGNRTYLVSRSWITSEPITSTASSSYQPLSTFTFTPASSSILTNTGDSILIRAVYSITTASVPNSSRNIRINITDGVGNIYNYTRNISYSGNSSNSTIIVELRLSRISSTTHLIIGDIQLFNGSGLASRDTTTLDTSVLWTVNIQGATPNTFVSNQEIKLLDFSIEKIKNDN